MKTKNIKKAIYRKKNKSSINQQDNNILIVDNFNSKVSASTNDNNATERSISDLDMHSTDIHSSTANDCTMWNTCENSRGKIESKCIDKINKSPIKKRTKPSYLGKCLEWKFIKDTKVSKQAAFKNGLFCDPVILGKLRLNV